jgi:hypothetical protein
MVTPQQIHSAERKALLMACPFEFSWLARAAIRCCEWGVGVTLV